MLPFCIPPGYYTGLSFAVRDKNLGYNHQVSLLPFQSTNTFKNKICHSIHIHYAPNCTQFHIYIFIYIKYQHNSNSLDYKIIGHLLIGRHHSTICPRCWYVIHYTICNPYWYHYLYNTCFWSGFGLLDFCHCRMKGFNGSSLNISCRLCQQHSLGTAMHRGPTNTNTSKLNKF